ncbi:MAG: hypothetical protein RL637_113 [Pseudomonadota bacterium]|jgi:hopanoid biosynthesis associated RND transporter like protein HpnN
MNNTLIHNWIEKQLTRWCRPLLSYPFRWLSGFIFVAILAIYYTINHLNINTDTTELIAPEASFQQNRRIFEKAFPQEVNTLLLVLESPVPELTFAATQRLSQQLLADSQHFEQVYIPNDNEFLRKNGWLYLNLTELQQLTHSLTIAQPFIGHLANDHSLNGLLSILTDSLTYSKNAEKNIAIDNQPLFQAISQTLAQVLQQKPALLSWQQLINSPQNNSLTMTRQFIIVRPKFNYADIMPIREPIQYLRQYINQIQSTEMPKVKVWITGEIGLEHDELEGVSQGSFNASLFSLVLVIAILWIAFRSWSLTIATTITLLVGMTFCGLFAATVVKELNLISIAFMVSNIGLGVEYAIHFCLRYKDESVQNARITAIQRSLIGTAPSLLLCAATTAIGLYAFIPTNYRGISELGLLAGSSLFICLAVTLTLLPVLLTLFPVQKKLNTASHSVLLNHLQKISYYPLHFAKPISVITGILAIISIVLVFQLEMDFNPINIRDPNAESVIAFKKLLETKDSSPMTVSILATHPDQVKQLQQQLAQLSVVDKTISLFDLVPEQQSEKLALIEETSLILGSQLTDLPPLKPATDPQQAIEKLLVAVEKKLIQSDSISQQQLFTQLTQQLKQLLIELDYRLPQDRQKLIEQLQNSLLGGLPLALKPLAMGLNAEEIDLNSIPFTLKQRWLSNEGWYRIQIFPKQDLNNLANLSAFITQVQSVSDKTTDLPVMFLESMKAVVSAFQQAIITAILTIALLLWWLRRQFIDMLLVMIPLLLSGLFTMACTVLTHTPINFANIIALPLLLGLGVDNGIHMLEKLRHSIDENQNLYQSSTARGIFYGALTTISSFIGLAFSPHQGVASMGLIITIGIFWIMIGTFIILPALSRIILPFTTTSNTHS